MSSARIPFAATTRSAPTTCRRRVPPRWRSRICGDEERDAATSTVARRRGASGGAIRRPARASAPQSGNVDLTCRVVAWRAGGTARCGRRSRHHLPQRAARPWCTSERTVAGRQPSAAAISASVRSAAGAAAPAWRGRREGRASSVSSTNRSSPERSCRRRARGSASARCRRDGGASCTRSRPTGAGRRPDRGPSARCVAGGRTSPARGSSATAWLPVSR